MFLLLSSRRASNDADGPTIGGDNLNLHDVLLERKKIIPHFRLVSATTRPSPLHESHCRSLGC